MVSLTTRLDYSISYTTRPMRPTEVDGKDYYFVSLSFFQKMIQNNRFLEWAEVYGNYYGTAVETVERSLRAGNDLIFDVDVEGAKQIKKVYNDAILIFVIPPSLSELSARLERRGQDGRDTLRKRLQQAKKELNEASMYSYTVVNDIFDEAVGRLLAIVKAERCRRQRNSYLIAALLEEPLPSY